MWPVGKQLPPRVVLPTHPVYRRYSFLASSTPSSTAASSSAQHETHTHTQREREREREKREERRKREDCEPDVTEFVVFVIATICHTVRTPSSK